MRTVLIGSRGTTLTVGSGGSEGIAELRTEGLVPDPLPSALQRDNVQSAGGGHPQSTGELMCPQGLPYAVVMVLRPRDAGPPTVRVSTIQDGSVRRVSELCSDDWLELSEVSQLSLTCVVQDVLRDHREASTS